MEKKTRPFKFKISCPDSTPELINNLIADATEITWKTFIKHVDIDDLLEMFPQYMKSGRWGLTIGNDWSISCHKSIYNGQPCYYLQHSGIEYIFVEV